MFRRPRPVVVRRQGNPLLGATIVGGAAYMAGKSSQRNASQAGAQEATAQPQAQTGPSTMPTATDRLTQLKQLADLRKSGVLNETEFEQEKQRILQGN